MDDYNYLIECSQDMMESANNMAQATIEQSGESDLRVPIVLTEKQGLTFSLVADGVLVFKFYFLNDTVLGSLEEGMFKMITNGGKN